ncbi:MAG: RDD family protein [Rubellimicrobium sp.]|nr:RDD family protein [Rubellimicrobium sp.]
MTDHLHLHGLPDPVGEAHFYRGVTFKRLLAWLIDLVPVAAGVVVLIPLTLFVALIFLPVSWLAVGLLYRWYTVSRHSATFGMQIMAIELRAPDGRRLGNDTAFLHALGYTVSTMLAPLQLVSIILMLALQRGQGLTDVVLGTAMINRPAR